MAPYQQLLSAARHFKNFPSCFGLPGLLCTQRRNACRMVIGKGEVRGAVTPESGMSHRGGRRRVLHGAERLEHEAADAHQRADLGGAAGELPEHARDGGAACAPLRTAPDGGRAGLGASARLRRRRAAGEGRRRPPLQRRARHRLLQACSTPSFWLTYTFQIIIRT